MPYHFTRITETDGMVARHVHTFDADSIPAAKKVCRRYWDRCTSESPTVHVTVSLHQRSGWSLSGDPEGNLIAKISGRHGDDPSWRKPPKD